MARKEEMNIKGGTAAANFQRFESLLLRTFNSLTVIGETSVDYMNNACFQTLHHTCHHCEVDHTEWMDSMMEVVSDVSAQDCFLFCTVAENITSEGPEIRQFSEELHKLEATILCIYHYGKKDKMNVTIRLSELRKVSL